MTVARTETMAQPGAKGGMVNIDRAADGSIVGIEFLPDSKIEHASRG